MKILGSLVFHAEEDQARVREALKKYPINVGEEPGGIAFYGTMEDDKAQELALFLESSVNERIITLSREGENGKEKT